MNRIVGIQFSLWSATEKNVMALFALINFYWVFLSMLSMLNEASDCFIINFYCSLRRVIAFSPHSFQHLTSLHVTYRIFLVFVEFLFGMMLNWSWECSPHFTLATSQPFMFFVIIRAVQLDRVISVHRQ